MPRSQTFHFDGGAGTYIGTGILAFLVTVCSLGIYSFWVVPRVVKWIVENTDFDPTWTPGPAFAQGHSQP